MLSYLANNSSTLTLSLFLGCASIFSLFAFKISHTMSLLDHFVLNFPCIASNEVSASSFDLSKFCCAFSIAFSHTSVIPREVANCPGVSFICSMNFHSSHALNLFARVETSAHFGSGFGNFFARL